ncbi:uncharacterized protein LOC107605235 isoform X2 [Arachis ipaensis]|uniref:uncharacterized protein LOC107605235 isoform X2 n=1 Tax=Arachis ipaensis TaxID=130454 RepID=UPI000A2B3D08|nr:uncharacterized protein LOC107605235 isoform X2 [Arachis ipaensis]
MSSIQRLMKKERHSGCWSSGVYYMPCRDLNCFCRRKEDTRAIEDISKCIEVFQDICGWFLGMQFSIGKLFKQQSLWLAKQEGLLVSLDLASFEMVRKFKPPLMKLLESGNIDLCFANQDEAMELLRNGTCSQEQGRNAAARKPGHSQSGEHNNAEAIRNFHIPSEKIPSTFRLLHVQQLPPWANTSSVAIDDVIQGIF